MAEDLSGVVFERVFPSLVKALAHESGEELPEVRQAALIFLYRLLFVLYAEDRGLLPVNDSRYDDYGMRERARDDVADRMAVAGALRVGVGGAADSIWSTRDRAASMRCLGGHPRRG